MVKGYRVGDTSLVVWWNDTDGEIAHAWDSVATRSGEDSLAYLRSEFVTIPTPTQRTGQTVNHAMRVGRIQSALQLESAIYTVPTPTFERIRIIYNIERSDAFRELMDETGKPRTGL